MTRGPPSPLERFLAAAELDRDRWRDGEGHDLTAIDEASPSDRASIEAFLVGRGLKDPRDVAALTRLGTPSAEAFLLAATRRRSPVLAAALVGDAGHLLDAKTKERLLIRALRAADPYEGLGPALDLVAEHASPGIVAALESGCLRRDGEVAVSFAGMLLFLHGVTQEPFDDAERPFLLRFATSDRASRRAALRDLRKKIAGSSPPWRSVPATV